MDILAFLTEKLTEACNLPVSTEIPDPAPDEFITIHILSGRRRDLIVYEEAAVVVQTYAQTEARAYEIMSKVRSFMGDDLVFFDDISAGYETSVRITNPTTRPYKRYEGVFTVIYRTI